MEIKIENVRDYELYVKNIVATIKTTNKVKAEVRKVCMMAFRDGIAFNQKDLTVHVD